MPEKIIPEILKLIEANLGISITLVTAFIFFLMWYIHFTNNRVLKSKDAEIDRLTKEKDKLQTEIIREFRKSRGAK